MEDKDGSLSQLYQICNVLNISNILCLAFFVICDRCYNNAEEYGVSYGHH